MRISDWSSDVCSSDLGSILTGQRNGGLKPLEELDRHWLRLTLIMWAGVAIWYVAQRWGAIHWLSLGDTDDNTRLMQVRGLLDGQGSTEERRGGKECVRQWRARGGRC